MFTSELSRTDTEHLSFSKDRLEVETKTTPLSKAGTRDNLNVLCVCATEELSSILQATLEFLTPQNDKNILLVTSFYVNLYPS